MDRGKTYLAPGIRVYYQARLCIHVAECVRGLPQVFDTSRKAWIQPEQASAEYERLDGEAQEPIPQSSSVRLVMDGPLYVRGPLRVKNAEGNLVFQSTRAALCRCGASKNKPFCDNSHREIGFQAPPGELDWE